MATDGKGYRTALVTGASSGIGRALSAWLARRGVRVFAAARRLDALRKLQADLSSVAGKLEPVEMDVGKARETIQQIQELDDASGGLDLIVANAGVGFETHAKRIQWDRSNRSSR